MTEYERGYQAGLEAAAKAIEADGSADLCKHFADLVRALKADGDPDPSSSRPDQP